MNLAVHFIRVKSSLMLSCSSGSFLFYILCYLLEWLEGKKRIVSGGGEEREEMRKIDQSSITGRSFSYFIYVVAIIPYRLLEYFFVFLSGFSILSWKVWCNVAIVVVLSNSIWCPVSMLCSDNADCMTCFNLTLRWCSFIRRLALPVSPMYTCPQEQGSFTKHLDKNDSPSKTWTRTQTSSCFQLNKGNTTVIINTSDYKKKDEELSLGQSI